MKWASSVSWASDRLDKVGSRSDAPKVAVDEHDRLLDQSLDLAEVGSGLAAIAAYPKPSNRCRR
jgi:hypothetical protein